MSENFDLKAFEEGREDELLRQTMSGHRVEPDPGLWKGISRKLLWRELLHFNFTNLSPKLWMAGTAGLLLVVTTLYFGFYNNVVESTATTTSVKTAPVVLSALSPVNRPATAMLPGANLKSTQKPVGENRSSGELVTKSEMRTATTTTHVLKSLNRTIHPNTEEIASTEPFVTHKGLTANDQGFEEIVGLTATSGISHILPYQAILALGFPLSDTIITISNPAGVVKFRKERPTARQFYSASLGLTPEVAFYSEPDVYAKTNFWLNGILTCYISRFSLATGFGLGYVYDNGKYNVEYKSRDSIGFFNSVTSYSLGTNNEIIYNTQKISVYDSLQHLGDYRTQNRYSYLQIPLLLGYRIFVSNRISMTFQTGPAISLLLGSRKSDPVIEYSNARIIRVDENTPSRIYTNWQLWANVYLEMRMNKQVSIYLEPTFKYFLKPMVSQENVHFKAPWTIGLGVGLQFNFGKKD